MAIGQFLTIRNYKMFEQVTRDLVQNADMDPALVFQSATPGFLQDLYQDVGAWKGRNQVGFGFPSGLGGAKAVSANERARMGGYDTQQVVAMPGFELAGETQSVYPSDFMYGGMDSVEVTRRAMRPRLDWNKTAFDKALDVATQGGKSTGAPIQEFAYTALDFQGNTVTKALVTESATLAADVVANSTQSILWPNRQGGSFSAGHDHLINSAGAAWTAALGAAHRDLILEHAGNGPRVKAIVGTEVASEIRAALVALAANTTRAYDLQSQAIPTTDSLGGTTPVAVFEGVEYSVSPDMDSKQAIYYAANKKPLYFSKGQLGVDGSQVGTGTWFDPAENPETRGTLYGFRDYLNLGVADGTAIAVIDYV